MKTYKVKILIKQRNDADIYGVTYDGTIMSGPSNFFAPNNLVIAKDEEEIGTWLNNLQAKAETCKDAKFEFVITEK